jgi:plastocyanin
MRRFVLFACVALIAFAGHPALAAEIKVSMAGGKFAPTKVDAKVGDTLVFVNDDTKPHNVFSSTIGHAFDMGAQPAGMSRNLALLKPGTFEVRCVTHHEDMGPSIIVTVAR